ncbi:MAG: erythromycin esterase family protein [Bacteroidota bacterium]
MKRLLLLYLATLCWGFGQSQGLLQSSMDYIQPLDSIQSTVLQDHVAKIGAQATIVGLGEVSHYTKECYEFKQAIIETLMEQGYQALILEVDFGQALIWNDYVTKGIGNLDAIIRESGWFTYRTEEFKALLNYIRSFNQTAATPFQIFGMEMTAMNHNLDWLKQYFSKNLDQNEAILKALEVERKIVAFYQYDQEEQQDYWSLFYQVQNTLVENESSLTKKGGALNYEIAQRISEIIRQYATFISHDDFRFKVEIRDLFSTRNVLWTMDQLGEDSKVVIWAHNGHVAKRSIMFDYDVLGHQLEQIFDDAYYSIGFTFDRGEFGAFSSQGWGRWTLSELDTPSLTTAFRALNHPYLLFDIRSFAQQDQSPQSFLRQPQLIRRDLSESYEADFPTTMEIVLSETYDSLLYIDQITYPTTVD